MMPSAARCFVRAQVPEPPGASIPRLLLAAATGAPPSPPQTLPRLTLHARFPLHIAHALSAGSRFKALCESALKRRCRPWWNAAGDAPRLAEELQRSVDVNVRHPPPMLFFSYPPESEAGTCC